MNIEALLRPLLQNIPTIYEYENDIFIGTMSLCLEQYKVLKLRAILWTRKIQTTSRKQKPKPKWSSMLWLIAIMMKKLDQTH